MAKQDRIFQNCVITNAIPMTMGDGCDGAGCTDLAELDALGDVVETLTPAALARQRALDERVVEKMDTHHVRVLRRHVVAARLLQAELERHRCGGSRSEGQGRRVKVAIRSRHARESSNESEMLIIA